MWDWIRRRNRKSQNGKPDENEVVNRAGIDDQAAQKWYDRKSALMEQSLGKEHDMVMHAVIPYQIGGGLDLCYYPNGLARHGNRNQRVAPSCHERAARTTCISRMSW